MTEISNVMLYIISLLLSVIAFFLIRFVNASQKTIDTVNHINLEQQIQKVKVDNIEKKVDEIQEVLKHSLYP